MHTKLGSKKSFELRARAYEYVAIEGGPIVENIDPLFLVTLDASTIR